MSKVVKNTIKFHIFTLHFYKSLSCNRYSISLSSDNRSLGTLCRQWRSIPAAIRFPFAQGLFVWADGNWAVKTIAALGFDLRVLQRRRVRFDVDAALTPRWARNISSRFGICRRELSENNGSCRGECLSFGKLLCDTCFDQGSARVRAHKSFRRLTLLGDQWEHCNGKCSQLTLQ